MSKTLRLPVAKVGEIGEGKTKSFRYGFQNGIAYNDGGTIKAYVNFCTHAGARVELKEKVFSCVMHFSEFDPKTGKRISGQAPEGTALKPIELIEEGGQIMALLEIKSEFELE